VYAHPVRQTWFHLQQAVPQTNYRILLYIKAMTVNQQKSRCSPLIVGVFISFIFNFYLQCNNKKMNEGSKKNEDASGRITIRHAPIRIAIFME
jgi:hypothetical protein